jgi:hypothetical protein
MTSTIFNWENDPQNPRIEFVVSGHEFNTDLVNLWIDTAEPKPTNAIASLTLSLEAAQKLGAELLEAVNAQRARQPHWEHIDGTVCDSEKVWEADNGWGMCDEHDRRVKRKTA